MLDVRIFSTYTFLATGEFPLDSGVVQSYQDPSCHSTSVPVLYWSLTSHPKLSGFKRQSSVLLINL